MKKTVLILGLFRHTLVPIRGLSRAGYSVVIGLDEAGGKEYCASRHVDDVWCLPDWSTPDRFMAQFHLRFSDARRDCLAILPVGDRELLEVNALRSRIEPFATILGVDSRLMSVCQDKVAMNGIARDAGLHVPAYEVLEKAELGAASLARNSSKLVLKVADLDSQLGRKAWLIDGRAEFDACVDQVSNDDSVVGRFIVQERVVGQRINCRFVARAGELLAYQEQSVLRTDVLNGTGYGVSGITLGTTGLLADVAALVEKTRYTGVGLAQFILQSGGKAAFLELNPRLDGSCAVAFASGFDQPELMCRVHGNDAFCSGPNENHTVFYTRVVRYHWLFGDVHGLVTALRRRKIGLVDTLRWLMCMLRDALRADVHLTFSWTDPLPALLLFGNFLKKFLRWN